MAKYIIRKDHSISEIINHTNKYNCWTCGLFANSLNEYREKRCKPFICPISGYIEKGMNDESSPQERKYLDDMEGVERELFKYSRKNMFMRRKYLFEHEYFFKKVEKSLKRRLTKDQIEWLDEYIKRGYGYRYALGTSSDVPPIYIEV
jgi:hypothetical protein